MLSQAHVQLMMGRRSSQRPPLPASAIEYWHSELGVSLVSGDVDTWTGQLRGTVMTQVNGRPKYLADGAFFNSRNVIQCSQYSNGARGMISAAALGTPLFVTSSRPWFMSVYRVRQLPANDTLVGGVVCYCNATFNANVYLN